MGYLITRNDEMAVKGELEADSTYNKTRSVRKSGALLRQEIASRL